MNDRSTRGSIEIIGLIAVVSSLILVAYEVRQTRQAILGETYLQMATRISSQYQQIASNELLLATIVKSEIAPSELTKIELLKLEALVSAKRFELDAFFYQYELGLLSDDFFDYMLAPEFRFWYPRMLKGNVWNSGRLRPEFKAAVEAAQVSKKEKEAETGLD